MPHCSRRTSKGYSRYTYGLHNNFFLLPRLLIAGYCRQITGKYDLRVNKLNASSCIKFIFVKNFFSLTKENKSLSVPLPKQWVAGRDYFVDIHADYANNAGEHFSVRLAQTSPKPHGSWGRLSHNHLRICFACNMQRLQDGCLGKEHGQGALKPTRSVPD